MRKRKEHGFCKGRIAWRLKHATTPQGLRDFLSLVCIDVPVKTIEAWTPLQRAQAEEWAAQVHLSASDNSHIRIPKKPQFLPAENDSAALDYMEGKAIG